MGVSSVQRFIQEPLGDTAVTKVTTFVICTAFLLYWALVGFSPTSSYEDDSRAIIDMSAFQGKVYAPQTLGVEGLPSTISAAKNALRKRASRARNAGSTAGGNTYVYETKFDVLFGYMEEAQVPLSKRAQFFKVIMCESTGGIGAKNQSKSKLWHWGLTQISDIHIGSFGIVKSKQLLDPVNNLRVAVQLQERDGWRPWNESLKGDCGHFGPNMNAGFVRDGWGWVPDPQLALSRYIEASET